MDYTIVEFEETRVIGLVDRTANEAPDCGAKIGALWQKALVEGEAFKIADANIDPYGSYGLYYNYDFSDNSYDVMVGCASDTSDILSGMQALTIPAGKYAKFSMQGDVVKDVSDFWNAIWEVELPRSYAVDFEAYYPGEDMQNAKIDIFISLK